MTNATTGTDRAYASLSEAEASEQQDLVAINAVMRIICSGTAPDTTPVRFAGWETDPDHYVQVESQVQLSGVWDPGVYRIELSATSNYTTCIYIQEAYVRIIGLQLSVITNGFNYSENIRNTNAESGEIQVSNCLIRQVGSSRGNKSIGIFVYSYNHNSLIWNNIIYGVPGTGLYLRGTGVKEVYNNTVYGCAGGGIRSRDDQTVAINNVVRSSGSGFIGKFSPLSNYNSSDVRGDAPVQNPLDNRAVPWYSASVDDSEIFIDAQNGNYLLNGGATIFSGIGNDLSSNFNDCIKGNVRNNWDLGADEWER